MPFRILMVDNNERFLNAAAKFLSFGGFEVSRAKSDVEAVAKAAELRPDLVLMAMAMPLMGGLNATRKIKLLPDPPEVVILTIDDADCERLAASSGADGFITKFRLADELIPLGRKVVARAALREHRGNADERAPLLFHPQP